MITSLNEYQQAALRTAPVATKEHDLLHAVLGLVTEAAELADVIKKNHAYGKPLDRVNMIEEISDVAWYCALACRALDTDLSTVATLNIDKLRKRYPEKFTEHQALNRDLDGERAVLEGKA